MSALKKLEFSTPITLCESTAIYDNNQGQKLLVKAYGSSQNEIEERTKNLLISLDMSTDENLELVEVTSIIPENENQSDSFLETDISSKDKNLEDTIKPLVISVQLLPVATIEPRRKLKFAFENILPNRNLRGIDGSTIQPVTVTSSSIEIYRIGPFTAVEAIITVQSGNASFSLYQSTPGQGNWQFVKEISVSTASPKTLSHRVNQNKYFKLMVQGRVGTNYIIRGDWVVN